ncbi:MAG: threonine ammonia-lyase [Alphaproteobacteria bacterium]|nr:threonine ammonia-lyase [Alphaproteobacteria bacterium]
MGADTTVTIDDIRATADRLAGQVVATPTVRSAALSDRNGTEVYLKLESLQRTGSFKDRGALAKMLTLDGAQAAAGVIAVSAGNHAQGVAYHAERLGIPATVVMPRGTPFNKIRRTEAFGARVTLHGDDVSAAEPHAHELAAAQGLTFIHPFDDPAIIAGQGTVALEMLAAQPDLDVLIVPVGGGGLISGIAVAAKAVNPAIEVVGVEAAMYPSVRAALSGGPPATGGHTLAEGIAVKSRGALNLEIIRALVDDIVLVDEPSLEGAVVAMMENANVMAEGAGAAPLAALDSLGDRFAGRRVGLIVSGANIDSRLLASLLLRGLARAGRLARLRILVPDEPGYLARVATEISGSGANIVEVYHQRMFHDIPAKETELDVVVETRDEEHIRQLRKRLADAGFEVRQLRDTARQE